MCHVSLNADGMLLLFPYEKCLYLILYLYTHCKWTACSYKYFAATVWTFKNVNLSFSILFSSGSANKIVLNYRFNLKSQKQHPKDLLHLLYVRDLSQIVNVYLYGNCSLIQVYFFSFLLHSIFTWQQQSLASCVGTNDLHEQCWTDQ